MIFAVDVGNTNIVFGLIEDGNILPDVIRARTQKDATWAEYAINIKDYLGIMGIESNSIDGAVISSVVPTVTESMSYAIEKVFGKKSVVVSTKIKTDITVKLDDPSSIGADLLVGAVGAAEYYGAPCIIIDLGTATTITALDKDNCFLGGAIIPGIKLGINALASGTSLLPSISISSPGKCISTNTVDCMKSGATYGTAAMIDGMIDRMKEEMGECKVIATGGLASSIIKYCKREILCDDYLLLKGLWKIYQKNK